MTSDNKPAAQPEPLPSAEHEKAIKQAERQQRNLRDPRDAPPPELPQTHRDD